MVFCWANAGAAAYNSPAAAIAIESAPIPLDLTLFSLDVPGFLTGWIKDSATKRRDPEGELPTSVGGEGASGKMVQSFWGVAFPDTSLTVVPAKAGTHNHRRCTETVCGCSFVCHRLWWVMGPGLRRDDKNYSRGAMRPEFCKKPCPRNQ